MKRMIMFFVAVVCVASFWQAFSPAQASAADYWMYGTADGTSYWADSNQAWVVRGGGYRGLLKIVENNQCVNRTMWHFTEDEGYLSAWDLSSNQPPIAIYAYPNHVGNDPVEDRPELVAFYQWLTQNAQRRSSWN